MNSDGDEIHGWECLDETNPMTKHIKVGNFQEKHSKKNRKAWKLDFVVEVKKHHDATKYW